MTSNGGDPCSECHREWLATWRFGGRLVLELLNPFGSKGEWAVRSREVGNHWDHQDPERVRTSSIVVTVFCCFSLARLRGILLRSALIPRKESMLGSGPVVQGHRWETCFHQKRENRKPDTYFDSTFYLGTQAPNELLRANPRLRNSPSAAVVKVSLLPPCPSLMNALWSGQVYQRGRMTSRREKLLSGQAACKT